MFTKLIRLSLHNIYKSNHYAICLILIECLCKYTSVKLEEKKKLRPPETDIPSRNRAGLLTHFCPTQVILFP